MNNNIASPANFCNQFKSMFSINKYVSRRLMNIDTDKSDKTLQKLYRRANEAPIIKSSLISDVVNFSIDNDPSKFSYKESYVSDNEFKERKECGEGHTKGPYT